MIFFKTLDYSEQINSFSRNYPTKWAVLQLLAVYLGCIPIRMCNKRLYLNTNWGCQVFCTFFYVNFKCTVLQLDYHENVLFNMQKRYIKIGAFHYVRSDIRKRRYVLIEFRTSFFSSRRSTKQFSIVMLFTAGKTWLDCVVNVVMVRDKQ